MTIHRIGVAALTVAAAVSLWASGALAQQLPPAQTPQKAAGPAKSAKPATAKEAQPAKAAEPGGDAQMKARIEQLEEQLADMQVVIGTLESLGRGGNAGPAASAAGPAGGGRAAPQGGGVDNARIDSLETQIRALSSQLEQLAGQVRQMSGSRRTDAGPGALSAPVGAPQPGPGPASSGFGRGPAAGDAPEAPAGGFGSTTVLSGSRDRDPIGQVIGGDDAPQNASAAPGLPAAASAAGTARELYETAYGYLLQQDYGAAEVSFEEFLRRYAKDRLAPDAQYWLGETLYVQKRYKPAAQAFLKVVEQYKTSAKVPNSLLKLAQSLEQLGQKDCGIFAELEGRHPNAPADVKSKGRALKAKMGC